MESPRIVLVEPQVPGNLGFVARLVENYGLADWVRVGGTGWEGTEAERTGSMARGALERLRVVASFEEAVAGCSHLVGLTARAGRHRQPAPLPALGELLADWGAGARVGLVFGREDRGLETEEAEACAALLTIPTAGFSSLNLSHAVAVVLYEWARAAALTPPPPDPDAAAVWSSEEDRRRLASKAQAELEAVDFPDRGDDIPATLRRLTARPLEARDLRMLERVLRHAKWRRKPGYDLSFQSMSDPGFRRYDGEFMEPAHVPFLSLSVAEAEALLAEHGASPLHAARLRRRILAGGDPADDPHAGFQLPKKARESLEEAITWLSLRSEQRVAAPDGSEKHLLRLADGEAIEAVRLPGAATGSACLSSQVGCAVACRFCASGLDGLRRNLATYEILEQVALLRRHGPVNRLVFMGAGEPSHNLRAIAEALPILRDEAELGPRYVLISTIGPVAAIDRMAAVGLKFTLALSLHALDQELRGELIPTQKDVDPLSLLDAADRFRAATGRSYQIEYVLLGGVNDSRADARELARALRGRRGHVSLIAWNPVPGMPFDRPGQAAVRAFLEVLHEEGTSVTLRNTVGEDASAACGQLRANGGSYPQ